MRHFKLYVVAFVLSAFLLTVNTTTNSNRIVSVVENEKIKLTVKEILKERPASETSNPSQKLLVTDLSLEFVGGFKVPTLIADGYYFNSKYLDLLPGTSTWASGHPKDRFFILEEPLVTSNDFYSMTSELKIVESYKVMENYRKISPSAVHWLNKNQLLFSGRKSYRSGYEANWLVLYDLVTQESKSYDIDSASNISINDFETLQAFGGGFMRIHDQLYAQKLKTKSMFLMGRGGYDVLGSPLGPSLASWEFGNEYVKALMYYPSATPAPRDPYYFYPNRDPNTYKKAVLPMWKPANEKRGFWQAGDVGGIAMINHPDMHGIVITKNFARGLLDYRAQGDNGSSNFFLVENPKLFYSDSGGGNRGNHQSETLNQTYSKGWIANSLLVISPDQLVNVSNGKCAVSKITFSEFDWPRENIPWSNQRKDPTLLGKVTWDDTRQLLWLAVGTVGHTYLVAYTLNSTKTKEKHVIKQYVP